MKEPIWDNEDFRKVIDSYCEALGWSDHGYVAPEVKWRELGHRIYAQRAELEKLRKRLEQGGRS